MWIKQLPADYRNQSSFCYKNVFLWQKDNVFVMDNHMAALWCWQQICAPNKSYNFMHIDRHYDLLDCFKDEDLEPYKNNPQMSFEEYDNQIRAGKPFKVLRWDNYIMAGYLLHSRWFHTNLFLTHKDGDKECKAWGHKPLKIQEESPLFMEEHIQQFIGEPSKDLYAFSRNDYKLPWIVNLDLDVFYTGNSYIQLFSDDYIRRIAELLQNNLQKIAVLTIAISPECLGGEQLSDKWENGFRILKIMSERIECLKEFEKEFSDIAVDN